MYLVEINTRTASSRHMPLTHAPQKAEQALNGQALKNLREAADKTQTAIGRALGMTGAGWQQYEAGARKFTVEKIAAALDAIGASEYDLDAEKARILGDAPPRPPGFGEARSDFVFDIYGRSRTGTHGSEVYDVAEPTRRVDLRQILGRSIDALELAGDRMRPWGQSGEIVLFDRDRAPRSGKGCVVELQTGEAFVYLYDKSDGSTLFVTELFPIEKTVTYPQREVKGVYPVVLRGD